MSNLEEAISKIIDSKISVKDILNLALYPLKLIRANSNEKEIAEMIANKLIYKNLYFRLFMDYFYQKDKDEFLHNVISSINNVNTKEEDFDDFFKEGLKAFILFNLNEIIDNEEIEDLINFRIDVIYKEDGDSYLAFIDLDK